MENANRREERRVTFSIEYGGRMILIEDVPVTVDPETGEDLLSLRNRRATPGDRLGRP